MHKLTTKSSETLTSNDIENLARRFGGKSEDYVEIVNKQKNKQTIKKYALLNEIHRAVNA
ncbi:hypothetical protein CWC16_05875 [Pseudoalteromonas sp. S3776]|uniref:BcsR/BcsP family cellulose biosynthesis protein n=1 Tax=Pseudoalteromonas undina TaxID=43660 RepID=A0ACC6R5K7_9GAMM|nr:MULTISPECIES: BcsR/BcsP family cellulose biosynthesis protein [unclassified Pseudoalteromonas]KPZ54624.1 hypothetical protein AN393_02247 [Pseudoalteromonas sp. P1-25]KPZ54893.1 hypothetical protein AN391_02806 [Pseudoalteromonas sp. P1-13-1a]KPZ61104.1 hypothetical protein AN389_02182 [Pseudoalteromonas sp. P1-7a]TMO75531.1 hypothetical protein CWC17_05995 [Pseudoalteromonas sp. S3785]TMO80905.1 hypothetical protein CWC16_05875 [Pseudoalteromonas sp. S3776]